MSHKSNIHPSAERDLRRCLSKVAQLSTGNGKVDMGRFSKWLSKTTAIRKLLDRLEEVRRELQTVEELMYRFDLNRDALQAIVSTPELKNHHDQMMKKIRRDLNDERSELLKKLNRIHQGDEYAA